MDTGSEPTQTTADTSAQAAAATDYALFCQRVGKRFGSHVAVDQVDLRVPQGSITGLLGPNGAGKTTLLRCIVGTLVPDAGRCLIDGIDSGNDPAHARAHLGYLPDAPALEDDLRCSEYLRLHASVRGVQHARQRIAEVLELVDLTDRARQLIGGLSRGQRTRLALAECLLHQPSVLILDEPGAGLDPAQVVALRGLLQRLAGSCTVLIATHQLAEVEATCDAVAVLVDGRIRFHGSPADLATDGSLEQGYLGMAGAGA